MNFKTNGLFVLLFLLLSGTLFGQIDLDEPSDKYLESDWIRQALDEKIQAQNYEMELNIVATVAPINPDLKISPQFIRVKEIEPDQETGSLYNFTEPKTVLPLVSNTKDSGMVDGTGPVLGSNYIKIYISNDSSAAGSEADYIYMRFGKNHYIKLKSPGGVFVKGYVISWDLNNHIKNIPQDKWDEISLETVSTDGILIKRLIIVHSGQEILDWTLNKWLDKWNGTYLGLGAKIMERKQSSAYNSENASVFYGAQEIGKTDGDKYGTSGAWCSEFASWCLRKSGVLTPTGSIGTSHMKTWFDNRGRDYYQYQIIDKTYLMVEGDYLSLFNGDHSAIFIKWVDSTDTVTLNTRFKTIEGNTGGTVKVVTRKVGDIDRVGRTK